MAFRLISLRRSRFTSGMLVRALVAGLLLASLGWCGVLYAATPTAKVVALGPF